MNAAATLGLTEEARIRVAVDHVLRNLTAREAEVLRLRFGIGERVHSLQEVSVRLGIPPARILQIESRLFRKIRMTSVDPASPLRGWC